MCCADARLPRPALQESPVYARGTATFHKIGAVRSLNS
jgi:hypothetical protein